MTLNAGSNCGFYTYGDVMIKTYDKSTSGIYFVFYKTLGTTCTLNSTLHLFKNETWLHANSDYADTTVCGYYVGIANSDANPQTINIIRTSATFLKQAGLAVVAAGLLLVSSLY